MRMKKILILGGSLLSADIIKAAKEMGLYTIVTDWYDTKKSPAKLLADEYWDISITDYDLLTKKIKTESIAGIITGFTDSYLIPYQILCERTGLPCYGTLAQFEDSLNKRIFKDLCLTHNIPVVPEYKLQDIDIASISPSNKILVKPVDNSGSRGIYVCDKPHNFPEIVEKSKKYSPVGSILIEKYMDCDDISVEYKIQDGRIYLSSICDRYIYKNDGSQSVTSTLIYPSKYLTRYVTEIDNKVRKMLCRIGLRNGVLFMQLFADEKSFYFYEMGYRLSGGRHFINTDKHNGDNGLKQLLNFAVTGKMSDFDIGALINPNFNEYYVQHSLLCKSRTIARIGVSDELKADPNIFDILYCYNEGDSVGAEGTSAQIFAKIHFKTSDKTEIPKILNRIKNEIQVLDLNGDNIIIDNFTV